MVSQDWLPGKIIPNRAKHQNTSQPVGLFSDPRSSALAKFPGSQLRWKGFPVEYLQWQSSNVAEMSSSSGRGVTRLTDSRYLRKSGGVGENEGTSQFYELTITAT
jgi:hypothetical protein